MLISNGLTRIGCTAVVNAAKYYSSSQPGTQERRKVLVHVDGWMMKMLECLSQPHSSVQLFLHWSISSKLEIGWKISDTQVEHI